MMRIIIPIFILLIGLGVMSALISSAGVEQRSEVAPVELNVKVYRVRGQAETVEVYSTGTVQPAQQVSIIPQVSGAVVSIADGLQAGRRFKKGDVIAQIERTDYRLVVEQELSRVEQAELNLKIEEERQQGAQREWTLLNKEGEAPELASRKPQLALAKISLQSAQASLRRAEVALGRTAIKAPFNSIVQMEQLEVGQVVGQAAPVANLVGTDQYWIRVSVPTARLLDIEIPDINAEQGSTVKVVYSPSDHHSDEWTGRVLRLEGALDPQARTANLLIGVDKPLEGEGLPLMIGAYVNVIILGKEIERGYKIPAIALLDGAYVLVADEDDKLKRKDVSVGWASGEEVILIDGVADDERVIITPISYPVYGSPLVVVEEN